MDNYPTDKDDRDDETLEAIVDKWRIDLSTIKPTTDILAERAELLNNITNIVNEIYPEVASNPTALRASLIGYEIRMDDNEKEEKSNEILDALENIYDSDIRKNLPFIGRLKGINISLNTPLRGPGGMPTVEGSINWECARYSIGYLKSLNLHFGLMNDFFKEKKFEEAFFKNKKAAEKILRAVEILDILNLNDDNIASKEQIASIVSHFEGSKEATLKLHKEEIVNTNQEIEIGYNIKKSDNQTEIATTDLTIDLQYIPSSGTKEYSDFLLFRQNSHGRWTLEEEFREEYVPGDLKEVTEDKIIYETIPRKKTPTEHSSETLQKILENMPKPKNS